MSKFIIRIDDICPTMNELKYKKVESLLDQYNIKPVIGVIPDNQDVSQMIDPPRKDFWPYIKSRLDTGWTIALHGYQHKCEVNDGGLLKLSKVGEFPKKTYEEQFSMVKKGLNIFWENQISTNTFMAPSHSFDTTTLQVLKDLDFKYITDGFSLYPYSSEGLIFVPQLFATPKHFGIGIYTICVHTNTMTDVQFDFFKQFIDKQHQKIIPFSQANQYISNLAMLSGPFLRLLRGIKKAI